MVGVDFVCVQVREIDAQCVVFSFGWNGSVHVSANLMIYLAVFMAAEWLSFVFCRVGFGGSWVVSTRCDMSPSFFGCLNWIVSMARRGLVQKGIVRRDGF